MKKIINGKKYDTDTATACGEYNNGLGVGDFNSLSETLYRKKTGEFFLHGDGGAMTRYGKHDGDGMQCGGADIVPISEAEAREWGENHLEADEYEALFGEVEE